MQGDKIICEYTACLKNGKELDKPNIHDVCTLWTQSRLSWHNASKANLLSVLAKYNEKYHTLTILNKLPLEHGDVSVSQN